MEKSTHALPPETVAKIAEMYADGYSFQEINEALDITSSFPRAKALRLADPTLEPRRQANIVARQQEKDKPVVDLFRTGLKIAQIAKQTGIDRGTIRAALRRAGIERRNMVKAQKLEAPKADPVKDRLESPDDWTNKHEKAFTLAQRLQFHLAGLTDVAAGVISLVDPESARYLADMLTDASR